MEEGGQLRACLSAPIERSSPPAQFTRTLRGPLMQSGYLRGEKIFVPLLGTGSVMCSERAMGLFMSVRPSVCLLAARLPESSHFELQRR